LMLFLDFYLRGLKHREYLGDYFLHPLHVIVHQKKPYGLVAVTGKLCQPLSYLED
jgi:hypothetical protein